VNSAEDQEPAILLLDEATVNIDNETEHKV
jgi:ABC-type bacteriocin/lantibiotic exporter with double-glycine peptidase domain